MVVVPVAATMEAMGTDTKTIGMATRIIGMATNPVPITTIIITLNSVTITPVITIAPATPPDTTTTTITITTTITATATAVASHTITIGIKAIRIIRSPGTGITTKPCRTLNDWLQIGSNLDPTLLPVGA